MQLNSTLMLFALLVASPLWLAGCNPAGTAGESGDHSDHDHDGDDGHGHDDDLTVGPQISTPDGAVVAFLNAVREGQHQQVKLLLTKKARLEMANAGIHPQPPGNPSAQFSIGQVRQIPQEKGAQVECTWTDSERTYDVTWILRQEDNSWRIAGMATKLFEDLPPLLLNFEDPSDMQAQVQAAEAEIARRLQVDEGGRQATLPNSGSPQGGQFR